MPKKKKKTQSKKKNSALPSNVPTDLVVGTMRLHPRGFGFVQTIPALPQNEDIFIPKHSTHHAMDGDKVEVEVNPIVSSKGPEGKVVSIIDRARAKLAGIVIEVTQNKTIVHVPLLGEQKQAVLKSAKKSTLKVGDRVVIEVTEWGNPTKQTVCQLVKKLKPLSDASGDIEAASFEFSLTPAFPKEVLEEVKKFGTRVSTVEIKKRKDLRNIETFTIDPDTAKDFDDALSLKVDKKGHYHLMVHIADVSHYVHADTHLDTEARKRANSTYFPGTCLPMLPKELSENLCSLKANVNRLVVTVSIELDPKGNLLHYEIFRAVIKSQHRFTYKEAKLVLDGKKESPFAPTLHLMVKLCHLLKAKRAERGSVEFCMPERMVRVDDKGDPVGMEWIPYDITHQLVEEFMLKANELVAIKLNQEGKSLTYRIHDVPDPENLQDFVMQASSFGFSIPHEPTPKDFQRLFDQASDSAVSAHLMTSYIRCMKLAYYSPHNIGHFGLGLTHYCHFTSPIRRYVDLIAHRLLFHEAMDIKELEEISQHASNQERVSARAEQSVVLLKKLRLLQKWQSEDPKRKYPAFVTKVRPFGFTFEILALGLEGFFHVADLKQDYFVFSPDSRSLKGRYHDISYTMGQEISVLLKKVDLIEKEAEWKLLFNDQEK